MTAKIATLLALCVVGTATTTPEKEDLEFGAVPQTPRGFSSALERYDSAVTEFETANPSDREEKRKLVKQWQEIVDRSAAQRHAHISRLFWYTDLAEAKTAATEAEKPILSLRMLGKLTDEYSCANSRFFRTALYANQEIGDYLRQHFVLHWQSVRPVPKVTIDFGDGRKLERTITGNSAHYVLTASGKPLDVLPGLYSPQEFLAWLQRAHNLSVRYEGASDSEGRIKRTKNKTLNLYHRNRLARIQRKWRTDIRQVAPELLSRSYGREPKGEAAVETLAGDSVSDGLFDLKAFNATNRAPTKAIPELPILRAIRLAPQKTDRVVSDKLWRLIADHHRGQVALDDRSRNLIRQENPQAAEAGRFAFAKSLAEDPILKVIRNFEESIALDTVRNKYLLEREIHNWFVRNEVANDLDELNERVYAELFLTPSSDPWLGLVPADTYTALQDNGFQVPTPAELGASGKQR